MDTSTHGTKAMPLRADEEDAFKARRFYMWKPGRLKEIKAAYNRRLRRAAKQELSKEE
jgi:hypothetical protein